MRSTEMRRRRCLRQGDKARRKGRREQIRSILDAESSDDREDALDDGVVDTEQLDAVRRTVAAVRPGPKPPAGKPPKQLLQTACVLAGKTKVACSKQPCAARLASGSVVPNMFANGPVVQPRSRSPMHRTGAEQSTTGEGIATAGGSAGNEEVACSKQPCAARLASGSVVPKVPANCHPVVQPHSRSPKAIHRTGVEQNTTGEGVGAESESAGKAMVLLEVTFCRSWNHVLVPQGWELR